MVSLGSRLPESITMAKLCQGKTLIVKHPKLDQLDTDSNRMAASALKP
jgi:hypothetical protein